jgi:hypothetical protein
MRIGGLAATGEDLDTRSAADRPQARGSLAEPRPHDARSAFAHAMAGHTRGKVVLRIAEA